MIAFCIHKPVDDVLLPARATTTAPREEVGRRRIDGESEEIGRLAEVGDEAFMEEEVGEDEDVHEEDEEEDDEPGFGGGVDAARGVLLCFD